MNEKIPVVQEYTRHDIIVIVIYCFLKKENQKVLKFPLNIFSYCEKKDSLF